VTTVQGKTFWSLLR